MNIVQALPRIAQIARRCPTSVLKLAYVDAARKFCGESRWLREDILVTTSNGDDSYQLVSVDDQLEIVGVRGEIIGTGLDGNEFRICPVDKTYWALNLRPGRPMRYAYVPEASIQLHVVPDAAYPLVVTAQVQPIDGATDVPDVLDTKWGRAIADGALGYLLDLPREPWTDQKQAEIRKRAFQAAISNAKADEQRGYNTGSIRARSRGFGTMLMRRW